MHIKANQKIFLIAVTYHTAPVPYRTWVAGTVPTYRYLPTLLPRFFNNRNVSRYLFAKRLLKNFALNFLEPFAGFFWRTLPTGFSPMFSRSTNGSCSCLPAILVMTSGSLSLTSGSLWAASSGRGTTSVSWHLIWRTVISLDTSLERAAWPREVLTLASGF